MKLSAIPLLMGSVLAFVPCMPLAAWADIPTSVQRFSCGQSKASYVDLPDGDGLGPTNKFIDASQTTTVFQTRNAGEITK
ncbi:MAG: hypothetical protein K2Z81_15520 [Cyanobacteria bacterium]|nr:hypothetical protein [Cyanobacteriota bacterium]